MYFAGNFDSINLLLPSALQSSILAQKKNIKQAKSGKYVFFSLNLSLLFVSVNQYFVDSTFAPPAKHVRFVLRRIALIFFFGGVVGRRKEVNKKRFV